MSRKDHEHMDESDWERLMQSTAEGLPEVAAMEQAHGAYIDALGERLQEAPVDTHVCRHGYPSSSPRDGMEVFQSIHFYLKACEVQEPHLEYDAFVGFWFMHSGNPAFSWAGVAILKSMAVVSVLDALGPPSTPTLPGSKGPYNDARMYLAVATKMEAALKWPEAEGDDDPALVQWSKAVDYSRESLQERGEDPTLREYYQAAMSICTNQGLVDYLVGQGICHCLDNISSSDKACDTCFQTPKEKLFMCSCCKVANYCSKLCQRKDWKKAHKRYCHKYLNLKNRLENMNKK